MTTTTQHRYSLSPIQQGMLFHHLSGKHTGVDIEQIVCSLEESLNIELFHDAWTFTLKQHDALRTAFDWQSDGELRQLVYDHVTLPFRFHDWTAQPPDAQHRQLDEFLQDDRRQGFELDTPPAMRVTLIKLSDQHYKAVWTVHHIVVDGRAFAIVLQDVFACYEALLAGKQPVLPIPPAYRDHIDWLQQRDNAQDETYWRQVLNGMDHNHTRRIGLPTPSTLATEPAAVEQRERRLTAAATAALKAFAADNDVTLNTLVQAGWALLLSRYYNTGHNTGDVIFGAVRACRKSSFPDADATVGTFINTLPVRVRMDADISIKTLLQTLRHQQLAVRNHEHTPLMNIQQWSNTPAGDPLFDSVVVYDHAQLDTTLKALGGKWLARTFELIEKTGFPITLYAYGEEQLLLKIGYDPGRIDGDYVVHMLSALQTLLEGMCQNADAKPAAVDHFNQAERQQLLVDWNDTATDYPHNATVHGLFEAQAKATPEAIALAFADQTLSYRQLNERANRLARDLTQQGVTPGALVGVLMERSIDMVVALLGVLKSGAAYVPLDPNYPRDRLAFMAQDARLAFVITQQANSHILPDVNAVCLDRDADRIAAHPDDNPPDAAAATDLAYVIYTSGSTGKPKGVMVEHRNVVNFFAGMDERIDAKAPGVWLAVTSISFDISVLELFWTLARGFKVVIHKDENHPPADAARTSRQPAQPMQFSLFYWNFVTEENKSDPDKYRLLMESAKFGDQHDFTAVWTPERHFHSFGGLYPNPSVISAALAAITQRIHIRAGSCVIPLHSPIRVAEEWAVVDNLSNGRVALGLASGWQPQDFAIKPENHANAKTLLFEYAEVLQRLWRGEHVTFPGPDGDVEVQTLPRPIQSELPLWITTAGNPATFEHAARIGANILTHLLGQSVEKVAENIALYRRKRREYGHAGEGHVTLLLHTLVGDDEAQVKALARQPMKDYLKSAVFLVKDAAWHFPTFKEVSAETGKTLDEYFASIPDSDLDALLDFAFERYYSTSGLFGSPDRCLDTVDRLKDIGVNEIGCLIDYGVATDTVLAHLPHLNTLRQRANPATTGAADADDNTLPALMQRHGVTHFQCTPSMAGMLVNDPAAASALASLERMMVGGEALPPPLAAALVSQLGTGRLLNMYGPTETTIWSSTAHIDTADVTLGRPIANTQLYILDPQLHPVPLGVAGELYIGGTGVTRGYLNRPELSAERFIRDPFNADTDARLYKTGDLARHLPDGTIEYLGRIDHQVKIRGHRIELGEIENAIAAHPAVRQNIVVAREDATGSKRLVAYFVPQPGETVALETLRNTLSQQLPDFMLPSAFVKLEALPLTPNGKVDRNALPHPEQLQLRAETQYVAPVTVTQKHLANILGTVLDVCNIGLEDNFFELGGHSIAAAQVVFQIRKAFDIDFPLQTIFQAPKLSDMADKIDARLLEQADADELHSLLAELEQMSDEDVVSSIVNH